MKYLPFLGVIILLGSCSGGEENKAAESLASPSTNAVTIKTGAATNKSISSILGAYYQLRDALVEADTVAANRAAITLASLADSVQTEGIKDSSLIRTINDFIGTIASEAISLPQEPDITKKRRSFSMITENLYPLLQSVQYNEAVIYHQMCPMAFNERETAYWLSDNREIMNPYLGKKHPKYFAGMVHCGEVKDSLTYPK